MCVLYIFWRSNPCLRVLISKYVFPYCWFSFYFNAVFFGHAEAFYFDEVPWVFLNFEVQSLNLNPDSETY